MIHVKLAYNVGWGVSRESFDCRAVADFDLHREVPYERAE
jgi:hypothetical protein